MRIRPVVLVYFLMPAVKLQFFRLLIRISLTALKTFKKRLAAGYFQIDFIRRPFCIEQL